MVVYNTIWYIAVVYRTALQIVVVYHTAVQIAVVYHTALYIAVVYCTSPHCTASSPDISISASDTMSLHRDAVTRHMEQYLQYSGDTTHSTLHYSDPPHITVTRHTV